MKDYMIRAMAYDDSIRAFAIIGKETVEEARVKHDLTPTGTAALGRCLMAGAMTGWMMKNEKDRISIIFNGNGPAGKMTVTADNAGHVKGYLDHPYEDLPIREDGKLDVSGLLGKNGMLRVIKDIGLKEPYTGEVPIVSGEVAEDLTYYFSVSEQQPSAVGLGVLLNDDDSVRLAGGFIIQVLPFASDAVIDRLEGRLANINSVTNMLKDEESAEHILKEVLGDENMKVLDKHEVEFNCDCSKAKLDKVMISLGLDEIKDMIDKNEDVEVQCSFCSKKYTFTVDELNVLYSIMKTKNNKKK